MPITITTLVENCVPPGGRGLIGEHGIAHLIETHDRTILFDTGQGLGLAQNASILGKDLTCIDTVVLSHGHYDHTGGLQVLIERQVAFQLIAHPMAFDDKRSCRNGEYRKIGMPTTREQLDAAGVKLRLADTSVEIAPGIRTTGEIPMTSDFEAVEESFFIAEGDHMTPDAMADDQSLIIESDAGLVVLTGCCHRGLLNTLQHVKQLTGHDKIHAVVGGLHMGGYAREKIQKTFYHLQEFRVRHFGLGHCTGTDATIAFFDIFRRSSFINSIGHVMKL